MSNLIAKYLLPLAMLASAGALATALIAQYGFGLEPCVLCSYQRIPYGAVLLIGLFAFAFGEWDRKAVGHLLGVIFLAGAGLAFYHNGVEQHWWEAATACGATGLIPTTVDELKHLLSGNMPKACDQIDWTLFGLSMTVYNTAASLVLALGCFWGARQTGETV